MYQPARGGGMCGIFGYAGSNFGFMERYKFMSIIDANLQRGRDAVGLAVCNGDDFKIFKMLKPAVNWAETRRLIEKFLEDNVKPNKVITIIGNFRAEPTTEYVKSKDVTLHAQPFFAGAYAVVHNGIVANDKQLAETLDCTGKLQSGIDSEVLAYWAQYNAIFSNLDRCDKFNTEIKGSFAVAFASRAIPGELVLMTNYKPLYIKSNNGFYFSSEPVVGVCDTQMQQYSYLCINTLALHTKVGAFTHPINKKALAICSGGLDSTVAAAWAKNQGYDVTLLHFAYGCRAELQELVALDAIASAMGVQCLTIKTPLFTDVIKGSPLTSTCDAIAQGIAGAEFAHEWVPARNLVFLSLATAIAESHGFGTLIFGNNLEESGAYPDNEPEFTARFQNLLAYATAADKHVKLLTPVGKMMKHEIVELGHEVNAPMHLTWSCYHNAAEHCGQCGPCFMRRTAYRINNLTDPMTYLK